MAEKIQSNTIHHMQTSNQIIRCTVETIPFGFTISKPSTLCTVKVSLTNMTNISEVNKLHNLLQFVITETRYRISFLVGFRVSVF